MKFRILFVALMMCACIVHGQRMHPDKRIQLAPDTTAHALISNANRRYVHTPLRQWILDNLDLSDSTLWYQGNGFIYAPQVVTVNGSNAPSNGFEFGVEGQAEFQDIIRVHGNDPYIRLDDLNNATTSRLKWTNGHLFGEFIPRFGIWNEPTEALDVPGTGRFRGLQDITVTTEKMVVADADGVLHVAPVPTGGSGGSTNIPFYIDGALQGNITNTDGLNLAPDNGSVNISWDGDEPNTALFNVDWTKHPSGWVLTDDQNIVGSSFDVPTGNLTIGIEDGTSQTVNLDGRYISSEIDGSTTNEIQNLSWSFAGLNPELNISLGGNGVNFVAGTGISLNSSGGNLEISAIPSAIGINTNLEFDSTSNFLLLTDGASTLTTDLSNLQGADDQQLSALASSGDLDLTLEDGGNIHFIGDGVIFQNNSGDIRVSKRPWILLADNSASPNYSMTENYLKFSSSDTSLVANIPEAQGGTSSQYTVDYTVNWDKSDYNASMWPGVSAADTTRWATDNVDDADNDPTNELFDPTPVYQRINDTAAAIRSDFPVGFDGKFTSLDFTGTTGFDDFADNSGGGTLWQQSGSDIYYLDRVGIGLNNPSSALEVVAATDFQGSSITAASNDQSHKTRMHTFNDGDFGIRTHTGSTDLLRLDDSTQRVGIATNSPLASLHVFGDAIITGIPNDDALTRVLVQAPGGGIRYRSINTFPTGITSESDPIFNAHLSSGITAADTTRWATQSNDDQTISALASSGNLDLTLEDGGNIHFIGDGVIFQNNSGDIRVSKRPWILLADNSASPNYSMTENYLKFSSSDTSLVANIPEFQGGTSSQYTVDYTVNWDKSDYNASMWPGVSAADTTRWATDNVDDADNDPTNELFDPTPVYQRINDTAAAIRSDFPAGFDGKFTSLDFTGTTGFDDFADNSGSGSLWQEDGPDIYFLNRVGVGINNPTASFEVVGATAFQGTTFNIVSNDLAKRTRFHTYNDGDFAFRTNGSANDLFRIDDATQRLGIGTNNPATKLHVVGDLRVNDVPNNNSLTRVLVEDNNGKFHYRDVTTLPYVDSESDPNSFYNADGLLTGDRTVDMDVNKIVFNSDNSLGSKYIELNQENASNDFGFHWTGGTEAWIRNSSTGLSVTTLDDLTMTALGIVEIKAEQPIRLRNQATFGYTIPNVSGSAGNILMLDGSNALQWVDTAGLFGGGGTSYTFENGLVESGGTVKLGGTLTANTTINTGSNRLFLESSTQSSPLQLEVNSTSSSGTLLSYSFVDATLGTKAAQLDYFEDWGFTFVSFDKYAIWAPEYRLIDLPENQSSTKLVAYDPVTDELSYADIPSGGSGSSLWTYSSNELSSNDPAQKLTVNNYTFDTDQTTGANEEGQSLVYNSDTEQIELLPIGNSIKVTNSATQDVNTSTTYTKITAFDTEEWSDYGLTWDGTNNRISVDISCRVKIEVFLYIGSTVQRVAPELTVYQNGTTQLGVVSATGYIRNTSGHNRSSLYYVDEFNATAGTTYEVRTKRDGNSGVADMQANQCYFKVTITRDYRPL